MNNVLGLNRVANAVEYPKPKSLHTQGRWTTERRVGGPEGQH
jgi:hypothetical protein